MRNLFGLILGVCVTVLVILGAMWLMWQLLIVAVIAAGIAVVWRAVRPRARNV